MQKCFALRIFDISSVFCNWARVSDTTALSRIEVRVRLDSGPPDFDIEFL